MKFEEALLAKQEFSETIVDCTYIFKTIIVPRNCNDFNAYLTDYKISNFDDNSAKKYSTDKSYMICSIWTNGSDVFKKVLKR